MNKKLITIGGIVSSIFLVHAYEVLQREPVLFVENNSEASIRIEFFTHCCPKKAQQVFILKPNEKRKITLEVSVFNDLDKMVIKMLPSKKSVTFSYDPNALRLSVNMQGEELDPIWIYQDTDQR